MPPPSMPAPQDAALLSAHGLSRDGRDSDAWSWLVLREAVLEGVTRFNVFPIAPGNRRRLWLDA